MGMEYIVRGGYGESIRRPDTWTGIYSTILTKNELSTLMGNLDKIYVRYDMLITAKEMTDRSHEALKPEPSAQVFTEYVERLAKKDRISVYWVNAKGHVKYSLVITFQALYTPCMEQLEKQYKDSECCDLLAEVLYR
jgi:hypothetical protein